MRERKHLCSKCICQFNFILTFCTQCTLATWPVLNSDSNAEWMLPGHPFVFWIREWIDSSFFQGARIRTSSRLDPYESSLATTTCLRIPSPRSTAILEVRRTFGLCVMRRSCSAMSAPRAEFTLSRTKRQCQCDMAWKSSSKLETLSVGSLFRPIALRKALKNMARRVAEATTRPGTASAPASSSSNWICCWTMRFTAFMST
mmetsp:Transcript_20946/g.51312  ORF Transcript_20946/g.51312 Transcript_20946/m.51312 type:complete len:202 (+) Transcript_20946:150-755(+)